jgi:hypothetical protein
VAPPDETETTNDEERRTMNTPVTHDELVHPFQRSGLGNAPFTYTGMSEKVYVSHPGAPALPGGTCDHCGAGIRYVFHIKSADGKSSGVGCDCILKLNRADNRFIGKVELEMKRVKREQNRKTAAIRKERERERIAKAYGLLADPLNAERLAAMPHPRGFKDRQTGYPLSLANYVNWMRRNAGHTGDLDTAKMLEKIFS